MPKKRNLNAEQKEAFKAIQKFIDHPAADTFVLKGYAGTGKTFLMQHLAKWFKENEKEFCLLASTGRAATVLRGKTGFEAKTVHSELYQFNKVDGAEEDIPDDSPLDKYGQMTLQFLLRKPDDSKKIYIIDEASMLSSDLALDSSFATFGSGILLTDFFEAVGNNKIIFVGDPGQLPPVGQVFSPALDMDWLALQQRSAITFTLKKIERNDPGNDILVLASAIRDMGLQTVISKYPKLPAANKKNISMHASQKSLFQYYVKKFKEVGINGTLAIARSNRMVQDINRAARRDIYGQLDLPLQDGDVLLVTQNNHAIELTNGDFVSVCSLGEIVLQANLHFQKVKVKANESAKEFELLVSLDILYGRHINFTKEQMKTLMVDFNRRIKKKNIKANTGTYKEAMKKDDFLNCLRAKYGYAVTCHKAQGGEWDDVFLFLEKSMYAMPHQELTRWWYTAVTRARKKLHLANEWWIV